MIISFCRRFAFEGLLYISNRVVSQIPSHNLRLWFYRRVMKFQIAEECFIFMDAWFDCKKNFVMGRNSVINQRCRIDNRGGITIGADVAVSSEVCILTGDHDVQSLDLAGRSRPVSIEDNVFIGTRATILPGVTLGEGCIVAAGAVVSRSVPPYTIVAGVPAKSIGTRNPESRKAGRSYRRLFH